MSILVTVEVPKLKLPVGTYPANGQRTAGVKLGRHGASCTTPYRQVQNTHSAVLGPPATHVLGSTPRPGPFPFVADLESLHQCFSCSSTCSRVHHSRHAQLAAHTERSTFVVSGGANSATKLRRYFAQPTNRLSYDPTHHPWDVTEFSRAVYPLIKAGFSNLKVFADPKKDNRLRWQFGSEKGAITK